MDCKKALQENNGDIEASLDWLRAKGLSKAAKKSDRAAAEGLVAGTQEMARLQTIQSDYAGKVADLNVP
eukprot:gene44259-59038_t